MLIGQTNTSSSCGRASAQPKSAKVKFLKSLTASLGEPISTPFILSQADQNARPIGRAWTHTTSPKTASTALKRRPSKLGSRACARLAKKEGHGKGRSVARDTPTKAKDDSREVQAIQYGTFCDVIGERDHCVFVFFWERKD